MILTQSDIVPVPPSGGRAPSTRHRWWGIPLAVVGLLAIAVPVVAAVIPASTLTTTTRCMQRNADQECTSISQKPAEFALIPANAEPVEPRLEVSGTPTYQSDGQIYFVTIREPSISMLDWFITHNNPAARLMSHYDKYGDQSDQQLLQSGTRQMTSAKDRATYVALKAAGFPVSRQDGPAVIDYLICLKPNKAGTQCLEEVPAAKVLKPDDTITAIDGKPVHTLGDLQPIMKDVEVGASISVDFERGGKKMTGTVTTIQAPGEDAPRTIIGFSPIDTTTVKLPDGLKVDFDTGDIGGPSAGTAFTLTLIDAITKGSLMGPQRVAVTGEIDIDGKVGAIGGLNSKASAVMQVGVKYFLVPASQPPAGNDPLHPNRDSIEAARKVVGDKVTIIPIATIDDALAALRKLGGDPLPAPAETPTTTTN